MNWIKHKTSWLRTKLFWILFHFVVFLYLVFITFYKEILNTDVLQAQMCFLAQLGTVQDQLNPAAHQVPKFLTALVLVEPKLWPYPH